MGETKGEHSVKGKLARVIYNTNLYVDEGINHQGTYADARPDDLVIVIDTVCHSPTEWLVHHQKHGRQYFIFKQALEVLQ
jgi:hypothetical protein